VVVGTTGSIPDVELETSEVVLLHVEESWWRFCNAVEVPMLEVEVCGNVASAASSTSSALRGLFVANAALSTSSALLGLSVASATLKTSSALAGLRVCELVLCSSARANL
jgi:hypothetical protein